MENPIFLLVRRSNRQTKVSIDKGIGLILSYGMIVATNLVL